MFGAAIRAASTFAAGMLFASILKAVLAPFQSILKPALGQNAMLVQSLAEVNDSFMLIIIISVGLAFIARAVVESRLPGGS
jgi:hypothetical protein